MCVCISKLNINARKNVENLFIRSDVILITNISSVNHIPSYYIKRYPKNCFKYYKHRFYYLFNI